MERFWAKVKKNDGCWDWLGYVAPDGYSRFWFNGKNIQAHRMSFNLTVGNIPKGLHLDHLCRNRGCVNPKHLEIVTLKENILRGIGLSAENSRKKDCPKCGGEYSIKKNQRVCVPCHKKHYHDNKEKYKKIRKDKYWGNRDLNILKSKEYYQKNKEIILAKQKIKRRKVES